MPSARQDGPCPLPHKAGGTRWPVTARGGPGTRYCHHPPHGLQAPTPQPPGTHSSRTVAGTMQILTSPAQLQRLEGILKKSLPLALPVTGTPLSPLPCAIPAL
ncbi:one cut domain family member 3-like [Neopelma chrysocephalum]|uniref:one cut domain family member 3-like n=1 Tax=Neopelma chrysocephalum TaxID=114329 RepID=UPI000FCD1EF8|nr:one cut domain family member 3-like [Neopelma chrysocephalum]